MVRSPRRSWLSLALLASLAGCSASTTTPAVVDAGHSFPIGPAAVHALNKATPDGAFTCASCHRSTTMKEFTCIGCHKHPTAPVNGVDINATLHLGIDGYSTMGEGCRTCHPDGRRSLQRFPHLGLVTGAGSACASCHDADAAFDAYEVKRRALPSFRHADTAAMDCGGCHGVLTWQLGPFNVSDPQRDLTVDAQVATWVDTTIVTVRPSAQVLHMPMNHLTGALDAGVLVNCAVCHPSASDGVFYPGDLHGSLTTAGLAQPTGCADCHGTSGPVGFVGPLDPKRAPVTGPMKHDAVAWLNGTASFVRLVTQDCVVCHRAPTGAVDGGFGARANFHASLQAAAQPQPTSCLDCHANSRPTTPVVTPSQVFDHRSPDAGALGDCKDCHGSTTHWAIP